MSGGWLDKAWRAYLESFEPEEAAAGSGPAATVGAGGTLIALLLSLAYLPPLARVSELEHVWYSVALVLVGATFTYVAWLHQCRGLVGSLATLFDNTFYSSALALAAVSARENVGIALAVVHGLMVVSFPGQSYALSVLFAITMSVPVILIIALFQPSLPIAIVLVCSIVLMLVFSESTRNRRSAKLRQAQLEQALGAADRFAEESVHAALTTTLLTLGHFLHELRNYQTAISVNLRYIEIESKLSENAKRALEEAQDAQRHQEKLLKSTIEDIRDRAQSDDASFVLGEILRSVRARAHGTEIVVRDIESPFEVRGNPEHLRVVLLNLVRNSEQAGANTVHLDVRLEPSGSSIQLLVHDDGRGIPEERRQRLFDTFAVSTKPGGSGLGLYLVRRYVELLGGQVKVDASPLGGACFVLRLPGHVVPTEPNATTVAPSAAHA